MSADALNGILDAVRSGPDLSQGRCINLWDIVRCHRRPSHRGADHPVVPGMQVAGPLPRGCNASAPPAGPYRFELGCVGRASDLRAAATVTPLSAR